MRQQSGTLPDIPKWSALLIEAVTKPGLIMDAFTAFHNYSIGNQILAIVQCQERGILPGPINTFPGWQALGRNVKRGERALTLCMPITCKIRAPEHQKVTDDENEPTYTSFIYKPHWFVISQTIGEEFKAPALTPWEFDRALSALNIEEIPFTSTRANSQGYSQNRQIAINPLAQIPHKTRFHELAHVVLGHTFEGTLIDDERTPRNLREVEAEAVALLCCEALNLDGSTFCRGYIQSWLAVGAEQEIPEKSAQKIFRAADQILKAGRTDAKTN